MRVARVPSGKDTKTTCRALLPPRRMFAANLRDAARADVPVLHVRRVQCGDASAVNFDTRGAWSSLKNRVLVFILWADTRRRPVAHQLFLTLTWQRPDAATPTAMFDGLDIQHRQYILLLIPTVKLYSLGIDAGGCGVITRRVKS